MSPNGSLADAELTGLVACPRRPSRPRAPVDAAAADLVEVLSRTEGHVTGADLVERCRAADPTTIPSTVYRTLDVLEELGLVCHSHAADGREEFHVLPAAVHGHLHCNGCGTTWEIPAEEASALVAPLNATAASWWM